MLPSFELKDLTQNLQTNLKIDKRLKFVFVVDGYCSDIGKVDENFKIICLGKNFGQYYSIYQGMKTLLEERQNDSFVVVCDYDILHYILKKLTEINELLDKGFVVLGINKNKKRKGFFRSYFSNLFYSTIYYMIGSYFKIIGVEADFYLRSLKYITSFSAFHFDHLQSILYFSELFSIYIFPLFLIDFDKQKRCFRKKIFFLDISESAHCKNSESSYDFRKLFNLFITAVRDLFSFLTFLGCYKIFDSSS